VPIEVVCGLVPQNLRVAPQVQQICVHVWEEPPIEVEVADVRAAARPVKVLVQRGYVVPLLGEPGLRIAQRREVVVGL
jgi:hypothetical protein